MDHFIPPINMVNEPIKVSFQPEPMHNFNNNKMGRDSRRIRIVVIYRTMFSLYWNVGKYDTTQTEDEYFLS